MFLFSGQVVERKGLQYLLPAWKRHIGQYPNDTLVICGDGDLLAQFKAQFSLAENIHFEGRIPYAQIHQYYAVADVFILPTLEDNWSLVVPEAMACGLPVATSIYNGCHTELIREGENGFTFDPYDEDSMLRVLANFHRQDLRLMGQKSVEIESQFSTENCTKRVFEVLKNQK